MDIPSLYLYVYQIMIFVIPIVLLIILYKMICNKSKTEFHPVTSGGRKLGKKFSPKLFKNFENALTYKLIFSL